MTPQERGKDSACQPLLGLVEAVQGRKQSLGKLPVGWSASAPPPSPASWIWAETSQWGSRAVGWLLTALAISLRAPFWFDLLSKLVNLRHGISKPELAPSGGARKKADPAG